MLEQLAKHGGFALKLRCKGDLEVDEHHTVEDCALALGAALKEALGDRRGITRFASELPMDEASVKVLLDLSGRPWLRFKGNFPREHVGGLPTELVEHFFRSLAEASGATLHIRVRGDNTHHMIESCFKGVGRALRRAIAVEGGDIPSTKGVSMTHDVALVDCGGANIASLRFALKRLGVEAHFTRDASEIENAARVILPGVGAAGSGMGKAGRRRSRGTDSAPDSAGARYLPGDAIALRRLQRGRYTLPGHHSRSR